MWMQRSKGTEELRSRAAKKGGASQYAIGPCSPHHSRQARTLTPQKHLFCLSFTFSVSITERLSKANPSSSHQTWFSASLSLSSWIKRYPSHLQPRVVPPMNRNSSATRLPSRPSAPHIHPLHQALPIRSSTSTLITVCDDPVEAVFLVLAFEIH